MSTTNGAAAPAQREDDNSLMAYLAKRKLHLSRMIPGGSMTAEKLITSAVMSTKKVAALGNVEMESVFLACMDAAELGLTVHWGPRGEAALIPFGKRCQLIVGYRGYIKLFLRSGIVRQIDAAECRENDLWRYCMTSKGVQFKWEPLNDETQRGEVVRYFCAAWAEYGCHVSRLTREKADKIRDTVLNKIQADKYKSAEEKAKKIAESPYSVWPVEMGIKAAVRQMAKFLPCEQVERALELEEQHEKEVYGERIDLRESKFEAPALPDPKARPQETIEISSTKEAAPVGAAAGEEEGAQRQQPARPLGQPTPGAVEAANPAASPREVSPTPVASSQDRVAEAVVALLREGRDPVAKSGGSPYERLTALFAKPGPVSATEFGALIKLADPAHKEDFVRQYNERRAQKGGQR